jgi:hypothetical protein
MEVMDLRVIFVLPFGVLLITCSSSESSPRDATDAELEVDANGDTALQPDSDEETVDTEIPDSARETGSEIDSSDSDADIEETLEADVSTATDGSVCWGPEYPQLGCPCDPSRGDQECCIKVAYGLLCSAFFKEWGEFDDCGCDPNPRCGSDPTFDLCAVPPLEPDD